MPGALAEAWQHPFRSPMSPLARAACWNSEEDDLVAMLPALVYKTRFFKSEILGTMGGEIPLGALLTFLGCHHGSTTPHKSEPRARGDPHSLLRYVS